MAYIYRKLRNELELCGYEEVANGIHAKNPNAKKLLSDYLASGSRYSKNSNGSQFIATTKDSRVAINHCVKSDDRVAVINLEAISDCLVYDVSTKEKAYKEMANFPSETMKRKPFYYEKAARNAEKSAEVDIVGVIPAEAFFIFTYREYLQAGATHNERMEALFRKEGDKK